MEYARGRLFKDPSLPGMTAEERKVRVESVRRVGGGGREGAHSIHFQNKYIGTKGRGTGKICSLQRTFVTSKNSLYRGFLYKRSIVDVVVCKNAYKFMPLVPPSTP